MRRAGIENTYHDRRKIKILIYDIYQLETINGELNPI